MVRRIAAAMALIVFALCLVIGTFEAGNTFETTVVRALVAMLATLVIGLVLGQMGQTMLEENLKSEKEKLEKSSVPTDSGDR